MARGGAGRRTVSRLAPACSQPGPVDACADRRPGAGDAMAALASVPAEAYYQAYPCYPTVLGDAPGPKAWGTHRSNASGILGA